jgi:hypothetical protein
MAKSSHTKVWNTQLVNEYNKKFEDGFDLDNLGPSPYYKGEFGWRAGDGLFQYTDEEIVEIKKCKSDILYFADKYTYAMTDNGIEKINLYPYQRKILRGMQYNKMSIVLASRQIGKCLSMTTIINIKNKKTGKIEETTILDLWYEILRPYFKYNLFFQLKYRLYKLYAKIELWEKKTVDV